MFRIAKHSNLLPAKRFYSSATSKRSPIVGILVGSGVLFTTVAYAATKQKDLQEQFVKLPQGQEILEVVTKVEEFALDLPSNFKAASNNVQEGFETTRTTVNDAISQVQKTVESSIEVISSTVDQGKTIVNDAAQTVYDGYKTAENAIESAKTTLENGYYAITGEKRPESPKPKSVAKVEEVAAPAVVEEVKVAVKETPAVVAEVVEEVPVKVEVIEVEPAKVLVESPETVIAVTIPEDIQMEPVEFHAAVVEAKKEEEIQLVLAEDVKEPLEAVIAIAEAGINDTFTGESESQSTEVSPSDVTDAEVLQLEEKPKLLQMEPKNVDALIKTALETEKTNVDENLSNLNKAIDAVDAKLEEGVVKERPIPKRRSLKDLVARMDQVSQQICDISYMNEKSDELLEVDKVIRGLATYLEHLEADEAARISQALLDQSSYFRNQMDLLYQESQKKIAENATRLSSEFANALQQDRLEHQKFLLEKLVEQANLFQDALEADLREQERQLNAYWQTQMKKSVDDEKDFRLARLDFLTLKLKSLERISIAQSDYIERSVNVTKLQNNVRALSRKLETSAPDIARELQNLQVGFKHDKLVSEVVKSVDVNEYVPREEISNMYFAIKDDLYYSQLMPEEGGAISYIFSKGLTYLLVRKHGNCVGSDTNAILARMEYFIEKGDLESASREGNSLKGWTRLLADDLLIALRGHLNVKQAIDVLETKVRLQHLGVLP